MGLNVDVIATKELLSPVAGEIFDDIDKLAAAVVAFAGVTFRVFIGERSSGRGHDGGGDVVFTGDEFQCGLLAVLLITDGLPESRIGLGNGIHETTSKEGISAHAKAAGRKEVLYRERRWGKIHP